MHFATRAVISLLAGVGAGTIGFGAVWKAIERLLHADPAGHDVWLLAGIFGPGVLTAGLVFRAVTRATERAAAEPPYVLDHLNKNSDP